MPLWLSDLLDDPRLDARLVAGRSGVDRRGPIRWAHSTELPDPTPWLEGGELLLTTGLGVRADDALQRRFVRMIAARGVVALGFSTGVSLASVPVAMLEEAESRGLPLFTVPYEVPFIAISRRVAQHSFEEHYATLRKAVDLHRQVLAAVVDESGVGGVLATVGRALAGSALLAFDFAGVEVARHDPGEVLGPVTAARVWAALPHDRARAHVELDGRAVTSASVMLGAHLEAVVVAVGDRPLLDHEELLFEQGIAGVSLELARHRSVREARRARVDELFDEVRTGRVTGTVVARTLHRIGTQLPERYRVLAVTAGSVHTDRLAALVEDALLDIGPPIVGTSGEHVVAVAPDGQDAAHRIVDAARRRGWAEIAIGRSRGKVDIDALRAALREADVAVRLDPGRPVRDIEELGFPGILAGIREDLGAADFVAQVLGAVLEHDAREGARLVDTLRAYLAHGCRPGPAAAELRIHRHTLTYRLERIRELTGNDPRAGRHLVSFGLALELHDRERPSRASDDRIDEESP